MIPSTGHKSCGYLVHRKPGSPRSLRPLQIYPASQRIWPQVSSFHDAHLAAITRCSLIAYQLSRSIPEIQAAVAKAVKDDFFFYRSLDAQAYSLITRPLNEAVLTMNSKKLLKSRPRLVIIDALDKCGKPDDQRYLLEVLSTTAGQLTYPLLFLVASRPEQVIHNTFNTERLRRLTTFLSLNDAHQVDLDVQLFRRRKFNVDYDKNYLPLYAFHPGDYYIINDESDEVLLMSSRNDFRFVPDLDIDKALEVDQGERIKWHIGCPALKFRVIKSVGTHLHASYSVSPSAETGVVARNNGENWIFGRVGYSSFKRRILLANDLSWCWEKRGNKVVLAKFEQGQRKQMWKLLSCETYRPQS